MKKIMMIAVMAVAAISANAQVWIGGNIGVQTNKTSFDGNKLSSNTSFEIAPEIGYNLSDKWAVALELAYSHTGNGEINFAGESVKGYLNSFSVKPYARYAYVKSGNFSAFVDGGINYTTSHVSGFSNNLNSFGVFFAPGFSYAVSNKVSLVAHLGDLSYDYTYVKVPGTDKKATNNAFNFQLFNGVSFGAYYNF